MNFIKLQLSNNKHYVYANASNKAICILGRFFMTDVGCPAINWDDWVTNDNQGLEAGGNISYLEKDGPYVYLSCLYDGEGNINTSEDLSTKLKISRHNLIQLIHDWREKVCKSKPKNVIITYDNDLFTLETSD